MASGTIKKARYMPLDESKSWGNVDLNDFTASGLYKLSGNISHNAGGNNYGILEVLKFADTHITQIFYGVDDDAHIYKRAFRNGTWYNWYSFTGTQVT